MELLDKITSQNDEILNELKELRKDFQELKGIKLSEMTSREYADLKGLKSVNTLYSRIKRGLYATPEGFTEPCYKKKKNYGRVWNADLADKYFLMNTNEA